MTIWQKSIRHMTRKVQTRGTMLEHGDVYAIYLMEQDRQNLPECPFAASVLAEFLGSFFVYCHNILLNANIRIPAMISLSSESVKS
jgi:hypothetical protein